MKFRLPILLLLLPLIAFADDDLKCDPSEAEQLNLDFNYNEGLALCQNVPPQQCKATIDQVAAAATDLHKRLDATCGHVTKLTPDLANVSSQRDAAARSSQIYAQLLGDYTDYIAALDDHYKQIKSTLAAPNGPLMQTPGAAPPAALSTISSSSPVASNPVFVQAEEQAIRQRLNDPKQLSQLTNLGKATNASEVTGADNKPDAKLFADINGANYMKKILKEKAAAEAMQAKISAAKDTADTNAAALAPPPSNNPDDKNKNDRPAAAPAAGGGLDLKSIAGLATAGAGLAEMMKKNDAANTDTASATSPTPPSQGAAGDKKGPSSSSFGTDKSTTPSGPQIGQPAPKKDPAVAAGHVPGGEGFREPSDISKGMGSSLGASGFTPASAKSTGGGAGGGGGGGLESSAAPASKHEPAAVANGQDDSQGFGGGGLLGGGGPPAIGGLGGPSMPAADAGAPPANPEDSMKDLLHEMKETAEGGLDPTKGQQAADIVMDDQDLFPRVRACYVRVLKQGRVLDGLGEKITEEVQ